MKPNIIIRADGDTSIGMGHIVRCIALADMLKNDFNIVFAIQKPVESVIKTIHTITQMIIHLPQTDDYTADAINFTTYLNTSDIVILDGYNFKTEYQKSIKNKGCKLVCIDDLHAWHQYADVVINHAEGIQPSVYSTEDYTQLYLGLNYVLLRSPFLNVNNPDRKLNSIKKVFISMGASDIANNSGKFTQALIGMPGIEEIHLMLGSINPNLNVIKKLIDTNKQVKIIPHFDISAEELRALLQQCDVAICPASSISLECCATGIGLISGYTAENQLGILNGLIKHKTLVNFGDINQLSNIDIQTKFKSLIQQPEIFNDLIANQKQMIDGKSPERLLNVFKNSVKAEQLQFRFAKEPDTDLYFKWANDKTVRENSYNTNAVVYEDHVKWFKSKLESPDCSFYLFFDTANAPVGQVRIDKSKNEVVIGISIDEAFRGKSMGITMLEKATNDYLQKHPAATIVAYIKVENKASYSIFKKAGFANEEIVMEQGIKSYKLYKK